jgi:glucose-6-phosphate dehydrogenase assembly protein OpcA
VAPALSSKVEVRPPLDWHGDAVTIGDVLTALTGMRRKVALAAATGDEHPHPRSYVMTLVAVTATETEESRAKKASEAIAAHHPSLAMVVRDEPNVQSGRIEASIATSHQPSGPSDPRVHFELITLHVRGAAGRHLAALVDPLLVSGVPTYLWWLGTPPFGSPELPDALKICDALVIDSAHFDAPYRSFLGLAELVSSSHRRLGLADFQWARLLAWRETIAQFFAPPDRRSFMNGIGEIGIDYVGERRGNRIGAALLAGWFAAALGWKLQRAAAGSGGVVAAHYLANGPRAIEVDFRSVSRAHFAEGQVIGVRIAGAAGGRTYRLSIQRDPERPRRAQPDVGVGEYRQLHPAGGEDEAGFEIAERSAARQREFLFQHRSDLHHASTGDPPGESVPANPTVLGPERRRARAGVLLTMIDIGEAETLRHVQRMGPEDDVTLLIDLLSVGGRDPVYAQSLAAAADLMRAI